MSKAFDTIADGLREAIAYQRGELVDGVKVHEVEVDQVDIKALRAKLGMTQEEFAKAFSFRLGTVAQWEQRRRNPRGPERVLLRVIEREPDAVRRALGG